MLLSFIFCMSPYSSEKKSLNAQTEVITFKPNAECNFRDAP